MSAISPSDASAMAQAQLAQEVSMKMVSKSLDAAKAQGEAALSLLEAAASIQDTTVPTADPGKGGSLDVSA